MRGLRPNDVVMYGSYRVGLFSTVLLGETVARYRRVPLLFPWRTTCGCRDGGGIFREGAYRRRKPQAVCPTGDANRLRLAPMSLEERTWALAIIKALGLFTLHGQNTIV